MCLEYYDETMPQHNMRRSALNYNYKYFVSNKVLTPSACGGRLAGRLGRHSGALRNRCLCWLGSRLGLLLGLARALPVVQHLAGQDHIQSEAGHKAVKNEFVVDLLEGSENARKRSGEVVEDL